jgi:hypothetical protein
MEWHLPDFVAGGFNKDEMAVGWPALPGVVRLHCGVTPQPGVRLYMQVDYELGDHGNQQQPAWPRYARTGGYITEVCSCELELPVGTSGVCS